MGLKVAGASVRFGEAVVVDDVTLEVETGSVLVILGPSGSGKSTLLRAIVGLEPLASGSISYDEHDLARVPTHKRGFALMFQDGQLFPHLDVAGNVGYPLRLRGWSSKRIENRVDELLQLVSLPGHADRLPSTLSGGERQRVALARALAPSPRLLLLDEPLSALDAELRERLAGELRTILTESGSTAVMVTHDQEEAFVVADRMAVMRAGRVVTQGDLATVWGHPPDEWTARFLGYASVVSGPAMIALGINRPGQAVAMRRSALVVTGPAAPGALRGTVVSAAATPDIIRLLVDVPGAGVVPAVAEPGVPAPIGEEVRLRLDESKIALVRGP